MIYSAGYGDKDEILALYRSFINGAADWNEYYPNEDTIKFDISRNALFAKKNEKGEIIAAISIDKDEDVDSLTCWNKSLTPSGEFSRLCVRKDMQHKGIAKEMIEYVFAILRKEGKKSVHILVKTGHRAALSLYSSIGFKAVGECRMFDKDFICMETQL